MHTCFKWCFWEHTHTHTHKVSIHPDQWAAIAFSMWEKLGVWCIAGYQRWREWVSFTPSIVNFCHDQELNLLPFKYKSNSINIRPQLHSSLSVSPYPYNLGSGLYQEQMAMNSTQLHTVREDIIDKNTSLISERRLLIDPIVQSEHPPVTYLDLQHHHDGHSSFSSPSMS